MQALKYSSMPGIIGKKIGMSQVFVDDGSLVPVTFLICEPNVVHQLKTQEKDGYEAVVLGASPLPKPTKTKKFKKLKEFSFPEEVKMSDTVNVEIFEKNDLVTISGVSKGKGFQGRIKLHKMKSLRKSHGTKFMNHGSTGQRAMPGRTKRGLRMPGRMGGDVVTVKKKQVVIVDAKRNLIAVKGSVPGSRNSFVFINKE